MTQEEIYQNSIDENCELKIVTNNESKDKFDIAVKGKDDKIYFNLIASRKSINKQDEANYCMGLHIDYFGYCPSVLDNPTCTRTIELFVNYANYSMVEDHEGHFLPAYKYVWADFETCDTAMIAKILELTPIPQDLANNNVVVYKGILNND